MAPSGMHIVNDTVVAIGKQFGDYSPHEIAVRDAMFILTLTLPTLGALLILLQRGGWWKQDQRLSFQTVSTIWLVSITVVGVVLYVQHGISTRSTFIVAALHEQIEYLLICVLLGFTTQRAFTLVWLFGLVTLGSILLFPSTSFTYMITAIIGGAGDGMMPLLLLYGKQWWLAAAGIFHILSAVTVFAGIVRNIGIVPYNNIIFLSVWGHVGFLVVGIMELSKKYHEHGGIFPKPMDGVVFKRHILVKIALVSFASSTLVTLFFAYILPTFP